MKNKVSVIFALLPLIGACTVEPLPIEKPTNPQSDAPVFTASLADVTPDAKVYLSDDNHLRWDGAERISIFSPGAHACYQVNNSVYTAYGVTSVQFAKSEDVEDAASGFDQNHYVALYPYNEKNSISANGVNALVVYPENQTWDSNYPMAAVTRSLEDHLLFFKAVGGFLLVPVNGSGIITGATIKGNAGEKIAGRAVVKLSADEDPVFSMMANDATTQVSFYRQFTLSNEGDVYYYFALPPITFQQGFTVEFEDIAGNKYQKTTREARTIQRAVYNEMEPVTLEAALFKPYDSAAEMEADVVSVLQMLGQPDFQGYSKPDDWSILMGLYGSDAQGADLHLPSSSYNWFSVCGEHALLSSYRHTAIRFGAPLKIAQAIAKVLDAVPENPAAEMAALIGELKAVRAYIYMRWAADFQWGPTVDPSAPCVPIIDKDNYRQPNEDFVRNTVADVYAFIGQDLSDALTALEGHRRSGKARMGKAAVLALRARWNLVQGNWEAAYQDASAAISAASSEGISPKTADELKKALANGIAFENIGEKDWIWGYDMTAEVASYDRYATTSSWLRSFSGWGYAASCQVTSCINNLLYDKIPSTDVRKGWWIATGDDGQWYAPLMNGITWTLNGYTYEDAAIIEAGDGGATKMPFLEYTNVKFGCNPIGTEFNEEDFPLIRIDEMFLIQAEAQARLGNEGGAGNILKQYVCSFRDPAYSPEAGGRAILDEIWFQRRVELWGEGFYVGDMLRFGKPMVRFHAGAFSNLSASFQFNLPAGAQNWILPIPAVYLNAYPSLVQNPAVEVPAAGSNGELLDGVTD